MFHFPKAAHEQANDYPEDDGQEEAGGEVPRLITRFDKSLPLSNDATRRYRCATAAGSRPNPGPPGDFPKNRECDN